MANGTTPGPIEEESGCWPFSRLTSENKQSPTLNRSLFFDSLDGKRYTSRPNSFHGF